MQEQRREEKNEMRSNQPQVGGRRRRSTGELIDGSDLPPRRRARRSRELPTQVGVLYIGWYIWLLPSLVLTGQTCSNEH